jgi:hypothetical protein
MGFSCDEFGGVVIRCCQEDYDADRPVSRHQFSILHKSSNLIFLKGSGFSEGLKEVATTGRQT